MQSAADRYGEALAEALVVAGPQHAFWNERFRSALERRGLTLAPTASLGDTPEIEGPERYPDGTPCHAPVCVDGPEGWPAPTVVVWQDQVAIRAAGSSGALIRPLLRLKEGQAYVAGPDELVITERHSIEDVLVHLVAELRGDRQHLLEVLKQLPAAA
jgi:hypothetical protein